MNLRTQIFLAAFALGLIPLLTLVGVNLRGHLNRHEEVGLQQAVVRQELELTNLNNKINHYRQTLKALALLPEVSKIVGSASGLAPSAELLQLINSWFSDQDAILEIALFDHHGQEKLALRRSGKFFRPRNAARNNRPFPGQPPGDQTLPLATTIGTGNESITATFRLAPRTFLADYRNSFWINSGGDYLHRPNAIKLTLAPGPNALADFPRLQPLLNKGKVALWESDSGVTVTWLPVILDGRRPTLWVGTEVDRTAAVKWKNSLIRNIMTITMLLAALILVIARVIAKKVDSLKEQILTGLERVMNNTEEFRFAWTGPKEIRAMAEDLSRLAQQYVRTSRGRAAAEAALRENQENFRNLTNSAQDAIVLMDHLGNISYWNQTAEEMFGYRDFEVMGKPIHPLISLRLLENRGGAADQDHVAGDGPIRETIELLAKKRDGSDLPVELSLSEARIRDKWHSIWIIRDISERKQAEEDSRRHQRQLIQADKMASLGLLVSGMAHEINNPNSIALLNTPMLARAWASVGPILDRYAAEHGDFLVAGLGYAEMRAQIPKLFTELAESSRRIRTIVKDLKDYARQDNTRAMELLAINDIATAAVRLTGNLIKKHTGRFSEQYVAGLPMIRGNSQRLEQVIINLLQNSCDALPDKQAAITLTTGQTQDGRLVYCMVADEGGGIPAESLAQLTDPFFTTKRARGGTGLGLSVSAGIIKEHGGTINFSSCERGTTVTINLPAATDPRNGDN